MNIMVVAKDDIYKKFLKLWNDGFVPAIAVESMAEMSSILRNLSRSIPVKDKYQICGFSTRSGLFKRFEFKSE